MNLLRTVAAAFSMYSAIPMPQFAWDEKTTRYLLCAFPLVGGVVGGAVWGWLVVLRTVPDRQGPSGCGSNDDPRVDHWGHPP